MKTKLVNNQICSLTTYLKLKCSFYEFKKSKSFLLWESARGFYDDENTYIPNTAILKDERLYIENDNVYWKPHLFIRMSNAAEYAKFFNNEIELNEFVEENFKDIKFIET
jgi:hypothetical protein